MTLGSRSCQIAKQNHGKLPNEQRPISNAIVDDGEMDFLRKKMLKYRIIYYLCARDWCS